MRSVPLVLSLLIVGMVPQSSLASVSPVSAFESGDAAFRERKQETRAREALETYRQAYRKNPKDPQAAWRVSMACYFVGLRLTKDKDGQKALFAEGRDAGLAGAELDDGCAPCHFWAAINMALYGQTVGVFKMLFTLNDLRDHLRRSIEIDPKYAYGGAYRLLGLIEQKLPGILGGNDKRAREYFEKAMAASPDEPLNYLFMARLMKDELDRPEEAITYARKGLNLPPTPPDRVESGEAFEQLREFLKKHGASPS